MKKNFNWLKRRSVVFLYDVLLTPVAWFCAYWLRFNLSTIPSEHMLKAQAVLPVLLLVQVSFFWALGLYRGVWIFASMPDLLRIFKAVLGGVLSIVLLLFLSKDLSFIPRSIFPLYGILLVVFLGGSRFLYRLFKEANETLGKRVLIVGAGKAGEGIVRDLLRGANSEYQAVVFVDDSLSKKGLEIHGVRVVGETKEIPALVKKYNIDLIIIAIPSASSSLMRRIVSFCEESQVPFRTLPGLNDLAKGNVKIEVLQKISLEDLLGRNPVSLDWISIRNGIAAKSVLVSGGGGSIGSELCRQIASLVPKKLIVVEQNEFNLYLLGLEMEQKFPEIEFVACLADVTDKTAIRKIFQKNTIDIVFHAAAYKHVPMLEEQLRAAMRNNILGTQILAEEAVSSKIEKFVLISTDKAVHPTNIMGATKRSAEIFCQNFNAHSGVQFITVRFGNVLGSAGSVVPLFRKQIEDGGPITVTHPDITRFFMTISEATQLILQATVIGQGGEIFVLDMGEPVKIKYLAEQMILLAGLKPYKDVEIRFTGLRPGEKLYEELFYEAEALMPTSHQKIMKGSYTERDWVKLNETLRDLKISCETNNEEQMLSLLLTIVPEYQKVADTSSGVDQKSSPFTGEIRPVPFPSH